MPLANQSIPAAQWQSMNARPMKAVRAKRGDGKVGKRKQHQLNVMRATALYHRLGSAEAVAAEMGVDKSEVYRWIAKTGARGNQKKAWTESEIEQVRHYYSSTPPKDFTPKILAKAIGRSLSAIHLKASRLGLGDFSRRKSGRMSKCKQADLPWARWVKHPHPRGMLGKRHSEENKRAQSISAKATWADSKANGTRWMDEAHRLSNAKRLLELAHSRSSENSYSRCKRGRRSDIGEYFFRSAWEANIARYLNYLKASGDILRWGVRIRNILVSRDKARRKIVSS